jgi:hypothetical protein
MTVDEAGDVRAIWKAIATAYPSAWLFKVVGSPYQMSGVPDLLVVVRGLLFGFEVKHVRPGESRQHAVERATPGQLVQIDRLRRAGAVADVVTSPAEVLALIRARLEGVKEH